MRVVILGAGVVGMQIAAQLISEGKDVVIIEKDPDRTKYATGRLDCIVLKEDGTNISTLRQAGMDDASIFIGVTNSDEVNMIACGLVASEFNVPVKIARVRNLDYSKTKITGKSFLGIDFIVNSEVETARQIANNIALGADSDVILFEDTDLQLRNIVVSGSFFPNRTTGGGIKVMRLVVLFKQAMNEMKLLIHPRGVFTLRLSGSPVKKDIVYSISGFFFLYAVMLLFTTLFVASAGHDITTSFTAALTALGNIGPGFGKIGPSENFEFFEDYVKWALSFSMLVGRLELYTVLVIFTPRFWRP